MSALEPRALHPSSASLADILERVLDKGVVIAGDVTVQLLDIELLTLKLRLLIASADTAKSMGIDWWEHDPARIRAELAEAEAALERGEMEEDTYELIERELLDRLHG